MRWTNLLAIFALVSCAKPEPAPAIVVVEPTPASIQPADIAEIKGEIVRSRAKLAKYRALPPCAPSGAVACRDDDRADQAASAERNATEALGRLQRSRERLPAARHSARALRDAVKSLTGE